MKATAHTRPQRPRRPLSADRRTTTRAASSYHSDAYWFVIGGLEWCCRCEAREKYYSALEKLR